MSISKALQKKDMDLLEKTVNKAVSMYGATKPEEPELETVYGVRPISAITSKKDKWAAVGNAYTEIISAARHISDADDKEVEIAKLIASNAILRHIVEPEHANGEGML